MRVYNIDECMACVRVEGISRKTEPASVESNQNEGMSRRSEWLRLYNHDNDDDDDDDDDDEVDNDERKEGQWEDEIRRVHSQPKLTLNRERSTLINIYSRTFSLLQQSPLLQEKKN